MSDAVADQVNPADGVQPVSGTETPLIPPREERGTLWKQEAVVAMGRRAVALPDLTVLMQDSAALVAEMLEVEYGILAQLSADGTRLFVTVLCAPSAPERSRPTVHECSAEGNRSLAAYAIQVAHPVAVTDLPRETRFEDTKLRKHAIRSAIAVPLKVQDRAFGALGAASSRTFNFSPEDLFFSETIAHLVTTTVARSHAEDSLGHERRLLSSAVGATEAIVLVLDDQGCVVQANPACTRLTGFSEAELKDRPFANVFPVPEELGLFHAALGRLHEGVSPVQYASSLLTKHSERRRVNWTFAAVPGKDGDLESILASAIDMTALKEAESRAQRAEQAAEEARRELQKLKHSPPEETESLVPAGDAPSPVSVENPWTGGLTEPGVLIPKERRRRPRRHYPYRQMIAMVREGQLPDRSQFFEIQCNDIGAGGFSFLSRGRPESDTLVVALGNPPRFTYLLAEVVHVTKVRYRGQPMYMIGCRYTNRVEYPGGSGPLC